MAARSHSSNIEQMAGKDTSGDSWSAIWEADNPASWLMRVSVFGGVAILILCWDGMDALVNKSPKPGQLADALVSLGELRNISAFGIQLLWFALGMSCWSAYTPRQPSGLSHLTWWKTQLSWTRRQGGLWATVGLILFYAGAVLLLRDGLAAACGLLLYFRFDLAPPLWLSRVEPLIGGGVYVAAASLICPLLAPLHKQTSGAMVPFTIYRICGVWFFPVGLIASLLALRDLLQGGTAEPRSDNAGMFLLLFVGIISMCKDAELRRTMSSNPSSPNL